MKKTVRLDSRGGCVTAHIAPWLMAGFLGMATLLPSLAAAKEPADAADKGIVVHGDWTITVSDSDGREVSTSRFRNALLSSGEFLLVRLLSQSFQVDSSNSNWHILASPTGTVDNEECNAQLGVPFAENPTFGPATLASGNETSNTFTLERDLKLPTTCIIGTGYRILEVWSAAQIAIDRGSLLIGVGYPFTKKVLDTPIDVLPGQVVSLSVTFSFS
ncbi:hypothetical protein [Haliea sp.]|uniref:hypothetical protein n=1 Tax=Haliea TaxID=475794 RepID=UPI00257B7187|nr:hypothetical protein [Haliea sp.]